MTDITSTENVPEQNIFLVIIKTVLAILGAGIAFVGGILALVMLATIIFLPETATVDNTTSAVAIFSLTVILGLALTWTAVQSIRSKPSIQLRLPPLPILIVIYVIVLGIGQILIYFNLLPFLTFPIFHIIAAIIPSLAIVSVVNQKLAAAGFQWREMIVQLAGGAFFSMFIALTLEIMLGGLLLVIVFGITALFPGGLEMIETLGQNLQDERWLADPENLIGLVQLPPVAISVGLLFVVLAPIIEEAAKLLGVASMNYRKPILAQVFFWGVVSGAGIGIVENLFNTLTGIQMWAFVMGLRVGSTLMHCFAAGLTAMGWHYTTKQRSIWPLLKYYALAVIIHAAWNFFAASIAGISIFSTSSTNEMMLAVVGGIVIVGLFLLVAMVVGMIFGFRIVLNRLSEGLEISHPETPTDSTSQLMLQQEPSDQSSALSGAPPSF